MIKFFTHKDSIEIKEFEIELASQLPLVFLTERNNSKILYEGKDFEAMHDTWHEAWIYLRDREQQQYFEARTHLDNIEMRLLSLSAMSDLQHRGHQEQEGK